eukprot:gnl/TRDRNA2_/TRDRNA2_190325_c0_seq1.p1 gnl/TRDRNA2_/TRDRNA2_190325_c0~~gnl/TRDRNA2_/TRDRNA2_190325_c0_seq1.p1  ORF type:complete len:230 (-),score=52.44 gnl/TRDRNA2_/TRDRNA2_190325_c0_seq1:56-664(-)
MAKPKPSALDNYLLGPQPDAGAPGLACIFVDEKDSTKATSINHWDLAEKSAGIALVLQNEFNLQRGDCIYIEEDVSSADKLEWTQACSICGAFAVFCEQKDLMKKLVRADKLHIKAVLVTSEERCQKLAEAFAKDSEMSEESILSGKTKPSRPAVIVCSPAASPQVWDRADFSGAKPNRPIGTDKPRLFSNPILLAEAEPVA